MNVRAIAKVEWYLMDCDLPNLNWARLRVFSDGRADVFDMDGNTWAFSGEDAACDWLWEDEYTSLSKMDADDVAEMPFCLEAVIPPAGATDADILPNMYMSWTTGEWRPRS